MKKEKADEMIKAGREFIRGVEADEDYLTDQELRLPQPPLIKQKVSEEIIKLPMDFEHLPLKKDFLEVIQARRSNRVYTQEGISLLTLSYLLWCTQGVKELRGKAYATLRTVPSGGARHPFECYMVIQNVEGLKPGLYHYLPMEHALEFLGDICALEKMQDQDSVDVVHDDALQHAKQSAAEDFINTSLCGQKWAAKADVVFYYSFVCYRAEWRYGVYAHRVVLIDAGHVTENLYLACASLELGACAVGALDGKLADQVFGLDGEEEYIFYAMPVGTIREKDIQKEKEHYRFVEEEGL